MTALLLAFALFAGWSLVGLALLALVRAETSELRIVLTAPAIGTCVTALAVFVFSETGVAVEACAVPIAIVLLAGSTGVLVQRRPRVHPAASAIAVLCVAGLFLTGWPMLSFGFGWLSNGNDDMSNYVLSAQLLLKHGLLSFFDFRGLAQGRDYATVLAGLHLTGSRPGSDILLAFVSRLVGRPPYEVFMPLILAFNLSTASAVGALAMQVAGRWWRAVVAAGLLLVSPLATYGVLQQLLPQVWGLGLATALFALLMRPELHAGAGARAREIVPIGILAAGLVVGYVELVPEMGLAYIVYVAVLGVRRQLGARALIRLWLPALAIAVIVLNSYFFTELTYLAHQAEHGLHNAAGPPLFGYILVPSGLPSLFGLQELPPGPGAPHLDLTIVLAAAMILGALIGILMSARRGTAAAVVLITEAAFGVLLVHKSNDFGLFKLSMYVQPFLAAMVAIWVSGRTRRPIQAAALVLLALLIAAELSTQRADVKLSRNPDDVPNLSASDVIPAFHAAVRADPGPVVSVTENPVLIKLEAASAEGRAVYFESRNVFAPLLRSYASEVHGARHEQVERALRSGPWVSRAQAFHQQWRSGFLRRRYERIEQPKVWGL